MTRRTLIVTLTGACLAATLAVTTFSGLDGRLTAAVFGEAATHDPHEHDESPGHVEAEEADPHEEHAEEHDEDGHDEEHAEDDHAEDELDEHDEHDGHGHEAEAEQYGIELATAGPGKIGTQLVLPGEVKLNEDRIAHIVPRAAGIVREVVKSVGDSVVAGETMAWIESAELGEAKVDYLSKWTELGSCKIDLARAEEIHDNTRSFLDLLKSNPSVTS